MNRTPPAHSALATVRSSNNLNGLSLAYLGDAVIELLVRERALESGKTNVGELNRLSREYVTAKRQSAALENILPVLTDEESDYFKRGRNAHGVSAPKSASTAEYRRATGMESLFGHLYLSGNMERARELFNIAYAKEIQNEEIY